MLLVSVVELLAGPLLGEAEMAQSDSKEKPHTEKFSTVHASLPSSYSSFHLASYLSLNATASRKKQTPRKVSPAAGI